MGLSDIREQIVVILAAVDGVGRVYSYDRWVADWKKFVDLFKDDDDKINAWMVSRTRTPENHNTSSHNLRRHVFRIRGVYGLKDDEASEIMFQDLIEDICDAFRNYYRLNNTANDTTPLSVEMVDVRMFGNVLCHYCEMSMEAEEVEAWG